MPLVDGGPRRLVHGVFGTVMRGNWSLPEVPALPAAVAERWRRSWGDEVVAAAARLIAAPPPLDLSFPTEDIPEDLDGVSLLPAHLRLARGTAVPNLAGYGEGRWWVQDIAASLPARLLGPGEGRTALDLCAAPGGKTMQLAAAGWRVTAVDISESRLARLSENLARTGLAADIVAADVMRWQPPAPVDAILLDAPCTATGIFRRHPDVLHRIGERQIAELAELQAALLLRAAQWLKPGGTLIYATCSLERAEGEEQVERFLAASPDFSTDPVGSDLLPSGMEPTPEGWVRTLPHMLAEQGRLDGFFVARLRRQG